MNIWIRIFALLALLELQFGPTAATLNPRFTDPSRDDYINDVYIPMGNTAENVAERYGISRQRQDEFAKRSQDRAVQAQKDGVFDREITPVTLPDGRTITPDSDCIRYRLASHPAGRGGAPPSTAASARPATSRYGRGPR